MPNVIQTIDRYPYDFLENIVALYSLRVCREKNRDKPLFRIRRSLDNAETDVYADQTGFVDFAYAMAFASTQSACFITTWYDQSDNENDAVQATAAAQPQLVRESNRYHVKFNQSQILVAPYFADLNTVDQSVFVRFHHDDIVGPAGGGHQGVVSTTLSTSFSNGFVLEPFNNVYTYKTDTFHYDGPSQDRFRPKTMCIISDDAANQTEHFFNGASVGTSPKLNYTTTSDLAFGVLYANLNNFNLDGGIYEYIQFDRVITKEEQRHVDFELQGTYFRERGP